MEKLRLYFRMVWISFRCQMEHKASFVMLALGNGIGSFCDFMWVWAMFDRFGSINGWSLPEVGVMYGVINMSFAVAEAWGRGFDTMGSWIKSGDFDRILLRPRATAFQVLAREFQLTRVGRLAQGLAILAVCLPRVWNGWGAHQFAVLLASWLGGVLLFLGILMMQAASCFWTVESLEVWNVLTYGGLTAACYPLSIYKNWLRRFFSFVVPLGFINYYPAAVLFDKPVGPDFLGYLTPVIGLAFCGLGLLFWRAGVRHYRSTGT